MSKERSGHIALYRVFIIWGGCKSLHKVKGFLKMEKQIAKKMGDEMEIGDAQEFTWCLGVPLVIFHKD